MEEHFNTQRLLTLRKLTRAVADVLRSQMKDYLSTLAPLLRPNVVLGDYIQNSAKASVKGADRAFKELQGLYESVAAAKPFNLSKELKPPIAILSTALDMTPMEYTHAAQTDQESKTVSITSPFKWVLNYSGFTPGRLKELLADRQRSADEVQQVILHYLVMHLVISKQSGITQILDALHFPVSSGRLPEFGELPVTYLSSSISTIRPPDKVIVENTEISGMNVFEEVINIEDLARMRDPLKERLITLVKSHGIDLPAQA
jgi:hypothetical protein